MNGRNGSKDVSISGELKRGLRTLVWATVFLYVALVVLGVIGFVDATSKRAELTKVATAADKVAEETHDALCTFKLDLERRVETTEQFLLDNPNGIPGLSEEAIETSISNQKQTIEALAILECES